jgi:HK97 family phage major capsid protein
MDYKRELIKRAFDGNAFISTDQYATVVNPKIWDNKLRAYEEKDIVFAEHAFTVDFRGPGRDYTVTVDAAPTAAAAVAETDAVAIQPISNRQVTFTPTEYGTAMQVSRKELVRAFFSVMENMTKKLGYALALQKDALGVTAAQSGATTALVANDVASSAIASTDTLGLEDFTRAVRTIKNYYYKPMKVFICPSQEEQIQNISQIQKANEFGSREAIDKGLVGRLFGVEIYVTHSIPVASNKAKAIFMGQSQTGEAAVGYAIKRDPMIEQDYDPLYRQFTIVAHEEYNWQVLHPNALVTVETYAA